MKKLLKIVFIVIVVFLVVAQFIRPSQVNPPIDPTKTLAANAPVPANIQQMFDRSCNDCHSNRTVYPWYSNVAPVSWLLADDIKDGRREVNFSEWGNYTQKRRLRKLKEICDQVKERDMPLKKYLPLHPDAKLSDADRAAICAWAQTEARREGGK
jgi:mono/diheme cytochrome c family protein